MATMLYIGTKPRVNGRYYIHLEDCPLLPSPRKRICLGTFLSPQVALEVGKKYFNNSFCCQFCLRGDHKDTEVVKLIEICEKQGFLLHVRTKITFESVLFFGVN